MKSGVLVALLLIGAGCRPRDPYSRTVAISESEAVIQRIVAECLHKPVEAVLPDATLASLGADELRVGEITRAVEERLGIVILESDLSRAAGLISTNNRAAYLTLRALVSAASVAPRRAEAGRSTVELAGDGALREAQMGVYGELSTRTNPWGYELVFVPSLDLLLAQSEQKLGRRLNEGEREALKQGASVVVLPPVMAAELERKRLQRQAKSR